MGDSTSSDGTIFVRHNFALWYDRRQTSCRILRSAPWRGPPTATGRRPYRARHPRLHLSSSRDGMIPRPISSLGRGTKRPRRHLPFQRPGSTRAHAAGQWRWPSCAILTGEVPSFCKIQGLSSAHAAQLTDYIRDAAVWRALRQPCCSVRVPARRAETAPVRLTRRHLWLTRRTDAFDGRSAFSDANPPHGYRAAPLNPLLPPRGLPPLFRARGGDGDHAPQNEQSSQNCSDPSVSPPKKYPTSTATSGFT